MRRMLAAALIAAIALLSLVATAGAGIGGSNGSPDRVYQRYAVLREQVRACVLDTTYRHLGREKRRRCRNYRGLYSIMSPGGSSDIFLHCYTRRCPEAPEGVVDPRAPIPEGFINYRP